MDQGSEESKKVKNEELTCLSEPEYKAVLGKGTFGIASLVKWENGDLDVCKIFRSGVMTPSECDILQALGRMKEKNTNTLMNQNDHFGSENIEILIQKFMPGDTYVGSDKSKLYLDISELGRIYSYIIKLTNDCDSDSKAKSVLQTLVNDIKDRPALNKLRINSVIERIESIAKEFNIETIDTKQIEDKFSQKSQAHITNIEKNKERQTQDLNFNNFQGGSKIVNTIPFLQDKYLKNRNSKLSRGNIR